MLCQCVHNHILALGTSVVREGICGHRRITGNCLCLLYGTSIIRCVTLIRYGVISGSIGTILSARPANTVARVWPTKASISDTLLAHHQSSPLGSSGSRTISISIRAASALSKSISTLSVHHHLHSNRQLHLPWEVLWPLSLCPPSRLQYIYLTQCQHLPPIVSCAVHMKMGARVSWHIFLLLTPSFHSNRTAWCGVTKDARSKGHFGKSNYQWPQIWSDGALGRVHILSGVENHSKPVW